MGDCRDDIDQNCLFVSYLVIFIAFYIYSAWKGALDNNNKAAFPHFERLLAGCQAWSRFSTRQKGHQL